MDDVAVRQITVDIVAMSMLQIESKISHPFMNPRAQTGSNDMKECRIFRTFQ